MAVLEKIRKRSVFLFIIIIGALLAFILGDFLNSGRSLFGPGDTVASVGDVKVKQLELSERSKALDENVKQSIAQMQSRGQRVPAEYYDNDYKYDQAFQAILFEKLMEQEYDYMGVEVPDEMLAALIYAPAMQNQVMTQLFGDQETYQQFAQIGIVDANSFREAIDKPRNYNLNQDVANSMAQQWKQLETEMEKSIRGQLYGQMFAGLFQPNKADAKVAFDNNNTTARVQMASVPLSTVADADVKIEDADYQAAYEKVKGGYALKEEAREIAYIVVPVTASQEDFRATVDQVAKLKNELASTEGLTAVAKYKDFSQKTHKLTDNQLPFAFRNDSNGIAVGQVVQVAPFTLGKVLDVTTGINNVVFDIFPAENKAQLDSIFGGKDLAQVDSIIKVQTQGAMSDLTTSLVTPTQNQFVQFAISVPSILDALTNGPVNQLQTVTDTIQGKPTAVALVVKDRTAPEPVFEVAEVSTTVYPSATTRQELTDKLQAYVANNGTANAFAEGTDYTVHYNVIDGNAYTIGSSSTTPGTRTLVKWAMEADKGQVSPVFTKQKTIGARTPADVDGTEEYLVALAVVDVYDDEYIPVSSQFVKNELQPMVTADKKAQVIKGKYNAKDFAGYVKAIQATPQTMEITYGAGTLGREAQGAVAGAKKGTFVAPVTGANAVYVFQVEDVKEGNFDAADAKTRIAEAQRSFRPVNFNNIKLFIGDRKMKNNMLVFTGNEAQD